MEKTNISETTTTTLKHQEWNVALDIIHPKNFILKEDKTGKILATIILPEDSNPEDSDPTLLNLIASAPELQDIAEMFQDHMQGGPMEKTMIFSTVIQVLERTKQPYTMEELAVCE